MSKVNGPLVEGEVVKAGEVVKDRPWISKEEYLGRLMFLMERLLDAMTPTPPPFPSRRGEWVNEKFGGRNELIVDCGVSCYNQVSVRQRRSILWSWMMCFSISGLL